MQLSLFSLRNLNRIQLFLKHGNGVLSIDAVCHIDNGAQIITFHILDNIMHDKARGMNDVGYCKMLVSKVVCSYAAMSDFLVPVLDPEISVIVTGNLVVTG